MVTGLFSSPHAANKAPLLYTDLSSTAPHVKKSSWCRKKHHVCCNYLITKGGLLDFSYSGNPTNSLNENQRGEISPHVCLFPFPSRVLVPEPVSSTVHTHKREGEKQSRSLLLHMYEYVNITIFLAMLKCYYRLCFIVPVWKGLGHWIRIELCWYIIVCTQELSFCHTLYL